MTRQVNLYEAKTNLSQLVEDAAKGEEIIIAKNGKPMVKLVVVTPAEAKPQKRVFGRYVESALVSLDLILRRGGNDAEIERDSMKTSLNDPSESPGSSTNDAILLDSQHLRPGTKRQTSRMLPQAREVMADRANDVLRQPRQRLGAGDQGGKGKTARRCFRARSRRGWPLIATRCANIRTSVARRISPTHVIAAKSCRCTIAIRSTG